MRKGHLYEKPKPINKRHFLQEQYINDCTNGDSAS